MRFADQTARLAARHPGRFASVAVTLALILAGAVLIGVRFDSETLDLLPAHLDSIQAFKIYDRSFAQASELTFVIEDKSGKTDMDAFASSFAGQLRAERWVVRVMDHSPIETPEGIRDLQRIAVPLLLNLPPPEFERALSLLDPGQIRGRLSRLSGEARSISPRAEAQLDPLGLVTEALEPLANVFPILKMEPPASTDGSRRFISVLTNQRDQSTSASRALMTQVEEFLLRARSLAEGVTPRITVRGRAAFAVQMADRLRHDVSITVFISIVLVGVGSGMLLFAVYGSERDAGLGHEDAMAASIRRESVPLLLVSMTSAAAFLCLVRSGSAAFAQVGVLMAIATLLSPIFMMLFFFALAGSKHSPHKVNILDSAAARLIDLASSHRKWFLAASPILVLAIFGFLKAANLQFDASAQPLEAGGIMPDPTPGAMQAGMPAAATEPVPILVKTGGAAESVRQWTALHQHWSNLKEQGVISGFSTPYPFLLSEERQRRNTQRLSIITLDQARTVLGESGTKFGFPPDELEGAFAMINTLAEIARGNVALLDWRRSLPKESAWWFILDRFFSSDPDVTAAYVSPIHEISDYAQFRALLEVPGTQIHLFGWRSTMAELIPWAKSKAVELTLLIVLIDALLVAACTRDFYYPAILLGSLALAIGAMIACLNIFNLALNFYTVLSVPLVLGIGVPYRIHVMLAVRGPGDARERLMTILRPVILSGAAAMGCFGALGLAQHTALRGLGIFCALGIFWCLAATLLMTVPGALWRSAR